MLIRIATYSPIITIGVMTIAVASIHLGATRPLSGFGIFILSWVAGRLLSLASGLLAWWRASADSRMRVRGQRATICGALLLIALTTIGLSLDAPPIHDITTSPDDAPAYRAALDHNDNAGRDLTYPHGGDGVISQQRAAYPYLRPIELDLDPDAAYAAALAAAEEIGLVIAFSSRVGGHIEAYAVSRVFGFVDDFVVRVRPAGSGSVVDVRSTSRVGRSDLGANAARIRAFAAALGSPLETDS